MSETIHDGGPVPQRLVWLAVAILGSAALLFIGGCLPPEDGSGGDTNTTAEHDSGSSDHAAEGHDGADDEHAAKGSHDEDADEHAKENADHDHDDEGHGAEAASHDSDGEHGTVAAKKLGEHAEESHAYEGEHGDGEHAHDDDHKDGDAEHAKEEHGEEHSSHGSDDDHKHGDAEHAHHDGAHAHSVEPFVLALGTPELTDGIPGEGNVTVDEIKKWLDDPKNHQTIQPQLPLGLAAAAANITGLDENPMTLAKIELGRQLYFDTRLSKDNTVSCASCHHPDTGYGAHTQFGVGIDKQEGGRNSPISYNRIISGPQFWDGRADSLEAQAIGPIENPIEMGHTHEACVECLAEIEGYRLQFEKIFEDGVNIDNVGKAIATFERTLVTGPAPYDYLEITKNVEKQWGEDMDEFQDEEPEQFEQYQLAKQEADKMSEAAKRGAALFFTEKSNCTACHAGANFADEKYHNLGVGMDADKPDLGRFEVTKMEIDKGAFKTPTLRNVALSAPFMHDGSQKTLEEVVEWYAKGGHPNPFLSEKMKKLELSDQDKTDLVAFMKEGLTSDFPKVEAERLPE